MSANNHWPSSRREVYALTVSNLLTEHSNVHESGKHKSWLSEQQLLDAAGYLSCLYLIADVRGFAKFGTVEDRVQLLNSLGNPQELKLQKVIETRVFESTAANAFMPAHRTIAEYLAARYLANRIEQELSLGRALALLKGFDGGIVTSLRGLHAWLAVFVAEARSQLIDADPMGVALYGDVACFSVPEKQRIFKNIAIAAKFSSASVCRQWDNAPLGALASEDMAEAIKAALLAESSQAENHAVALVMLKAMEAANAIPSLATTLLYVVRNSAYPGHLRVFALQVYLKHFELDSSVLHMLLDEIRSGVVADAEDELLGKLLAKFYPSLLSIETVLDHLHRPKNDRLIGIYKYFWCDLLLRQTADELLPQVCDALAKIQSIAPVAHNDLFWDLSSSIVPCNLTIHGDKTDDETVFNWLGLCLDKHHHSHLDKDGKVQVYEWFQARPARYKAILRVAFDQLAEHPHFPYPAMARLHGAPKPADFNEWLFQQALGETDPAKIDSYYNCFFGLDGNFEPQFAGSADELARWTAASPAFADYLAVKSTLSIEQQDRRDEIRFDIARRTDAQEKRRAAIRADVPQMLKNAGRRDLLHILALTYLGISGDSNSSAEERLTLLLGEDNELRSAVIFALKNTLNRRDLPSVDEIINSAIKNKVHFLTPAIIVSCELMYSDEAEKLLFLNDALLSIGVASFYVYGVDAQISSDWFDAVAMVRPELVAQACIINTAAHFKKSSDNARGLYALAHSPSFAKVAKLAVLPLLSDFPLRAKLAQLPMLESLLKAGIAHLDREALLAVIVGRLAAKTLDPTQRTYWLGAALVVNETAFLQPLIEHVKNSPDKISHLSKFFTHPQSSRCAFNFSDTTAAGLVNIFGVGSYPEGMFQEGFVNSAMSNSWRVRDWLGQLANSATTAATTLLLELEKSPALQQWAEHIRDAMSAHAVTLRDTRFDRPTVAGVETV
ncbi:hypothetical protein, partial [Undibacterium sp.]|uniref:hypothetical protein n=1 Tax=Undibacterium sp. TaxID=1914977 RepID=UPI0037511C17